MKRTLIIAFLMSLLFSACEKIPNSSLKPPSSIEKSASDILKVSVFRDGRVNINGKELSIDDAVQQIGAASSSDSLVYYYREAGQEEPHPNASKIIASVIDANLAISLSSEPDFSTYVDENGQIKKREE